MAVVETAAGAAATGVATAAAVGVGLPPPLVIMCAMIGGLISAWLEHADDLELSARWATRAVAHAAIASCAGLAISSGALAVLPEYPHLAPIAKIPHWAMAGAISALIFKVGPSVWAKFFKRDGAPNA